MKKFLKIRGTANNNHHNTNNTEILDVEGYLLFPKVVGAGGGGGGEKITLMNLISFGLNC
jgi:hypothetical protein